LTRRGSINAGKVLEYPPTLETDRLILRRMTPSDAEAVFAYASDPEVTRYVIWETHRSIEDSRAFLDLVAGKHESGGEPDWGIVYKGDHHFVGTCGIVSWEPDHARAELGYALSRHYWGRGLMVEAVQAMIAFCFDRMNLNRIEARCIAENVASTRVMEKAGMTHEGTLRQREFIKGAYRDIEVYSILRSEPPGR
jgi:[ribosomal protein S5]-alanine N-acetyltransferase